MAGRGNPEQWRILAVANAGKDENTEVSLHNLPIAFPSQQLIFQCSGYTFECSMVYW